MLEACYARIDESGAVLISVDAEAGTATIRLAVDQAALGLAVALDFSTCAPIASSDGPAPGEPSSERLTVGTTTGAEPAYDPAEPVLQGELVTVVLTFHNDSSSVQSLTFEGPLEADTGPVQPGELKLIVVRQLEPGAYAFYSSGAVSSSGSASTMQGVLHIEAPSEP